MTEQDTGADEMDEVATEDSLLAKSDLWVGLIVIGLICYVLLLGIKVIFF